VTGHSGQTGFVNQPEILIRVADAEDRVALEDALLWACNWSPDREPLDRGGALTRPEIVHYVAGWPAPGDLGVVAEAEGPIGAAWLRHLPADDPGYGFVVEGVPELSIGVHPDHRGQGIGRRLLRALLAAAGARGISRVSLSVERANRARELYLDVGFRVVGGNDDADTMLLELPSQAQTPPPRTRGGFRSAP
jgi:GNAT superfamily N-acetyltransferase